jgi:transcriptional regulator with XRE-family HTH domain
MDASFDGLTMRAIRLSLGLTQKELAEKISVSRVFVGMMERGEKPISSRTQLALLSLRPRALEQKPREYDPLLRQIEEALIENGVDFTPQFRSDGQLFDFFLPEFEIGICLDREISREIRPTRQVRGIVSVAGSSAAEAFVLLLKGRPLRAARPIRNVFSAMRETD